jgi:VCBS repeat-containing protein
LGDNVENLSLTGTAHIDGTGNALDNLITGNSGNNVLRGLDGNDTLVGGAGNDLLDGGSGADLMQGGTGDDTYVVDAEDTVVEAAGGGTDTVLASGSHVLAANVENLVLLGSGDLSGTGNALNNAITGTAGANLLDGGAGADTLTGGAGDDVYIVDNVGDVVVEAAGEGVDTVYASASTTLSANVENLVLTGTGNIDATGNAGDNSLTGNSGANTLAGGAGNDVLAGGAGNDTYVFQRGDGADRIIDAEGSDVLRIGGGLKAADLDAGRRGDDLLLRVPGTGDSITVVNWFSQGGGIGSIAFDDGTTLDHAAIEAIAHTPPVAAADAFTVQEDDGRADIAVPALLANDTYFGDAPSVVGLGASGAGAEVALDGDTIQYYLGDRYQALAQGEVLKDSFSYTISNSWGETSTAEVSVEIVGANDGPVTASDAAQVSEDSQPATSGNVLANDSDVDHGTVLQVVAPGTFAGDYGSLTIGANGDYSYTLNSAAANVQALGAGEVVVEHFTYVATDGIDAVGSSLDITVVGTNDAAVTAGDTAHVTEDLANTASGNVLANDHDVDAGTVLQVASPGTIDGSHGELALAQDGSYVYRLDAGAAAIQSMGREASLVEHFDYLATDGIAAVASTLDVTIAGSNDAPIVVKPLADRDVTFNKAFSFVLPANSFTDVDQGDTLTYSAKLADGSDLPSWLKFDATTGTFSGRSPKQVGSIDVRVTATDQVAASGSTEGSLSVSDVFRLSVSHGNEGVGNGPDAPPAGHDTNQNDGPGTGPGNPGSKLDNKPGKDGSNGKLSTIELDVTVGSGANAAHASLSLTVPTLLAADVLGKYLPGSSGGNVEASQTFGRWLAVDLAVSEAAANQKPGFLLDVNAGVDAGALSKATAGYLGSTKAFGGDPLAAVTGAGNELKGFEGLGKGVQKIK